MGAIMYVIQKKTFANIDTCAEVLANDIANTIRQSFLSQKSIFMALSGGTTPKYVLPYLASTPNINWANVTITLTDERCVSVKDKRSNEHLMREKLLTQDITKAHFFGLWKDQSSLEKQLVKTNNLFKEVAQPLDIVYLGMGEDGHIASLFPNQFISAFKAPGSFFVSGVAPVQPKKRISLSIDTILNARCIFLQLGGPQKRATYERALAENPTPLLPVSLILSKKHPGLRVYLVD